GAFELCVTDPGAIQLDSSEIPIVLINTLGQAIPDEPKIAALMQIKYNGPGAITYLTDPANVYDGHIGIERRGASSYGYPQRPYSLETRDSLGGNNNVSLLGMPAENDWVLLSNYNDRSLVRNQLAHRLFADMGQYAPRTHLCEVLIDSVYKGIYLFGEKIKRDSGRVDIARLTPLDNAGDELTGGYILQQNYWDNFNSFQSNYAPIDHPGFDVHFVYEEPAPADITPQQRSYIAAYVDSLETALYSPAFADTATGYRRYLDTPSFIAYFLVNELARSNDGFKKSVFFHKDKASNGGKLKAGPTWDFDWAWKDLWGCDIFDNTDGSGWAHLINDCPTDNYSCGWYVRLLQDSSFTRELQCTYQDLRATVLDTAYMFNIIDSIGDRVRYAQQRHFQKWPILGISGPAPEVNPVATTYAAELDTLKAWITRRLVWLDAHMPGLCTTVGLAEAALPPGLLVRVDAAAGLVRFIGSDPGPGPHTLMVHDVLGRTLARLPVPAGPIDVVYAPPGSGAYLYALWGADGVVRTGKWVMP
ncbi:MAG: CotH kinase family protein, partial [Flavobacteriales bacterium]|nr:CotH kinase family protein [Flavobacteriales bacterium]